jgi:hypothetical protein
MGIHRLYSDFGMGDDESDFTVNPFFPSCTQVTRFSKLTNDRVSNFLDFIAAPKDPSRWGIFLSEKLFSKLG